MSNQNSLKNRLCLFVFYEKYGRVKNHVEYFVKNLKPFISDFIVIVNGDITDEGKEKLKPYAKEILVRENVGYDITAYKYGLDYIGYEKLATYDEVIIANDTMFGPLYPFSEMFDKMDSKLDLDFWGITKHSGDPLNPMMLKLGYTPEHIQSYFMAFRKNMVIDPLFKEYWETLPPITDRTSAIETFEVMFTRHFSEKGFKWDVYVDSTRFDKTLSPSPVFTNVYSMVSKSRCPVFKKSLFGFNYDLYLNQGEVDTLAKLYDYIRENNLYDTSYIWEAILDSFPQFMYSNLLGLDYFISNNKLQDVSYDKNKCALLVNLLDPTKIKHIADRLIYFVDKFDIFVMTDKEDKAIEYLENYGVVAKTVINNKEYDFSKVLKEYLVDYKIACYLEIGESLLNGEFYANDPIVDTFAGGDFYVDNVVSLFEKEPCLGMLCYRDLDSFRSDCDYFNAKYSDIVTRCETLGLRVPLKEKRCHIVPQANCFYFRVDMFKGMDLDGVEPFYYSLIAQNNGYFTGIMHSQNQIRLANIYSAGYVALVENVTQKEHRKNIFAKVKYYLKKDGPWGLTKRVFSKVKRTIFKPKGKKDSL